MKKKTIKIMVIIIICLLITVLTVLLLLVSQKEDKYRKFLSLGDNYLQELNYEDAIAAYSEAINIMPKKENAYIQLSNVYISNHDYVNAKKVLGDYIGKAPFEEQSEAIQEQQELIEEKEKMYSEKVDENETLPDEEENIVNNDDIIAIAKRVLGMEYVGGTQFERSFEKREGTYGITVITSPVDCDNILSVIKKDFDGDEQEEILVAVRNYHPDPVDVYAYNTLSFYMLEQNGENWSCQDQIAVDKYDLQNRYNFHAIPKKIDFYLKEIDGGWNIYFEGHEFSQYFSDGYRWLLFGCTYTNNKFETKFETIEIEGSSIDEYLYMDPEMTTDDEGRKGVLEFMEKIRETGLNINKIGMDYPTMDVEPSIIKLCRIEYTAQFQHEVLMDWRNDSTSQSISGITEKNIDYVNSNFETAEAIYMKFLKDQGLDNSYYKILNLNEQNEKFLLICSSEDIERHKDNTFTSGGSENAQIYGIIDGNVSYIDEISCRANLVLGYRDNQLWVPRLKEVELYEVQNYQLMQIGIDNETTLDIIVFDKFESADTTLTLEKTGTNLPLSEEDAVNLSNAFFDKNNPGIYLHDRIDGTSTNVRFVLRSQNNPNTANVLIGSIEIDLTTGKAVIEDNFGDKEDIDLLTLTRIKSTN